MILTDGAEPSVFIKGFTMEEKTEDEKNNCNRM